MVYYRYQPIESLSNEQEQKIRQELKGMTDNFCATFHQCADEILKNPSQIPKEFQGRESEFIGQKCIKKVMELTEKK